MRRRPQALRKAVEIGPVREFVWDDWNLAECAYHGFGPRIARQVKEDMPQAFPNRPSRRREYLMIGQSSSGAFWTIAIESTGQPSLWYPLTEYPSNPTEIEHYYHWIGKPAKKRTRHAHKA